MPALWPYPKSLTVSRHLFFEAPPFIEPVAAVAAVPVPLFRVPWGFCPFLVAHRESPYRTIEAFLGTSTHCLVRKSV
jgi:hypothetical protein